jgi:hypothetical protein
MSAAPSRISQKQPRASVTPRGSSPERWHVDAGDAAVATLVIPADAHRERRFEISCAMSVRALPDADEAGAAWHQLTVLADGSRQWQRRIASHLAGGSDGLDYRFERSVPPGRALRLSAEVACSGARRERLWIEVDEVV